jgi:hypothetical protein
LNQMFGKSFMNILNGILITEPWPSAIVNK